MIIGLSLLIGQVLRLKANLLEVPISGMLVLGVRAANTGDAAWDRIMETLIGAGVGVLATLLLPPKVATGSAADAIAHFADDLATLLRRAANQVVAAQGRGDRIADNARDWLDDVRTITHDVPNVGQALLHAEEGRKLNVRAIRVPDAAPGLRQGLEALEHSGVELQPGPDRALRQPVGHCAPRPQRDGPRGAGAPPGAAPRGTAPSPDVRHPPEAGHRLRGTVDQCQGPEQTAQGHRTGQPQARRPERALRRPGRRPPNSLGCTASPPC